MHKSTLQPLRLTVIIGDTSPFVHLQEPPDHRRVTIDLTQEQRDALALYKRRTNCGDFVSMCFLEFDDNESEAGQ